MSIIFGSIFPYHDHFYHIPWQFSLTLSFLIEFFCDFPYILNSITQERGEPMGFLRTFRSHLLWRMICWYFFFLLLPCLLFAGIYFAVNRSYYAEEKRQLEQTALTRCRDEIEESMELCSSVFLQITQHSKFPPFPQRGLFHCLRPAGSLLQRVLPHVHLCRDLLPPDRPGDSLRSAGRPAPNEPQRHPYRRTGPLHLRPADQHRLLAVRLRRPALYFPQDPIQRGRG